MSGYRKDQLHAGRIADAFGDVQDGRVYFDGRNYRVRRESFVEAAGVPTRVLSSRGPIAPWNQAVKAEFPGSAEDRSGTSEFYRWATKGQGLDLEGAHAILVTHGQALETFAGDRGVRAAVLPAEHYETHAIDVHYHAA